MNWKALLKAIGSFVALGALVGFLLYLLTLSQPLLIIAFTASVTASVVVFVYMLYIYWDNKDTKPAFDKARELLKTATRQQAGDTIYWYCLPYKPGDIWAYGEYNNRMGLDDVVCFYSSGKTVATFYRDQAKELFKYGITE